jgi:hypothetical protein
MNRSANDNAALLVRQPARLAAGALGAALLLVGLLPLTERFLAHLQVWSLTLPIPHLSDLALAAMGAAALLMTLRRRDPDRPHLRKQ